MSDNVHTPPTEAADTYRPPETFTQQVLAISRIRLDGNTQTRVQPNAETVADYTEEMHRNGPEAFPPIDVFFDEEEDAYWLADGFHRVAAAQCFGAQDIHAKVFRGSRIDALVHNTRANRKNGLPRTNADKRRAVQLLLAEPKYHDMSDRVLAALCYVGNQLVGDVRREFDEAHGIQLCDSHSSSPPAKRMGRDGKLRAPASGKNNSKKARSVSGPKVSQDADTMPPVVSAPDVRPPTDGEDQPAAADLNGGVPVPSSADEDQPSPQQVAEAEHPAPMHVEPRTTASPKPAHPDIADSGPAEGLMDVEGTRLPPDRWDNGIIPSGWVQDQINTLARNNEKAVADRKQSVAALRAAQTILIELVRTANRVTSNQEIVDEAPLLTLNDVLFRLRNYTNLRGRAK